MLALWSLTTLSKSACRCHSCLNTTTKLARRTTTATGRSRLKVSECLTACYSTILGSAVLLDAAVKENRKREWDRRIAEVKESIPIEGQQIPDTSPLESGLEISGGGSRNIPTGSQSKPSSQKQYTSFPKSSSSLESTGESIYTKEGLVSSKFKLRLILNEKVPWYERVDRTSRKTDMGQSRLTTGPRIRHVFHVPSDPWVEPINRASRMRPESFQLQRDARMSTKLSVLDAHLKQSIKAASTLRHAPRLDKTVRISVEDGQFDDRYPHREPTKDLHLEKLEGMIARLVARLLITVKTSSATTATKEHVSQIQKMQARIEALQCRHTQLPEYSWISEEVVREERQGLFGALVKLNNGWGSDSNIELIVAKICYNLLICTAPPDMAMYNLLLEIFTNRKLPELGQVIVDSFLYESRYRPNSNTVRLMYLHYTEKGDLKGFEAIQKRMNAVDGKDLRLMRQPVWLTHKDFVARWISSKNVMWRGSFIHEIFEPSPAIHDTMMKGFIKLRAIQKSVGLANKQISDGNYISPDTLDEITTACIETGFNGGKSKHFGSPHILVNILEQIMSNNLSPEVLYETAEGRRAIYTLRQMAVSSNFYKKWQHWTEVAWEILTRRMGISYVTGALCAYSRSINSLKTDIGALRMRLLHSEPFDNLIPTSMQGTESLQPFKSVINSDAPENEEHSFLQYSPQYTAESPEILMDRITTKLASMELHLIKLQESMIHMSVTYVPRNVAVHRFIRYQKQRRSFKLSVSNNVEELTKELAVLSRIHASPRAEHYYRISFEQARSLRNQAVEAVARYRWRKKLSQMKAHTPSQKVYRHNRSHVVPAIHSKQKLVRHSFNSIDGAFGADLERSADIRSRTGIVFQDPAMPKSEIRNKDVNQNGGRIRRRLNVGDPFRMESEIRRRGAAGRGGRIRRKATSMADGISPPNVAVPVAVSVLRSSGSVPLSLLPQPSNSQTSQAAYDNS